MLLLVSKIVVDLHLHEPKLRKVFNRSIKLVETPVLSSAQFCTVRLTRRESKCIAIANNWINHQNGKTFVKTLFYKSPMGLFIFSSLERGLLEKCQNSVRRRVLISNHEFDQNSISAQRTQPGPPNHKSQWKQRSLALVVCKPIKNGNISLNFKVSVFSVASDEFVAL